MNDKDKLFEKTFSDPDGTIIAEEKKKSFTDKEKSADDIVSKAKEAVEENKPPRRRGRPKGSSKRTKKSELEKKMDEALLRMSEQVCVLTSSLIAMLTNDRAWILEEFEKETYPALLVSSLDDKWPEWRDKMGALNLWALGLSYAVPRLMPHEREPVRGNWMRNLNPFNLFKNKKEVRQDEQERGFRKKK